MKARKIELQPGQESVWDYPRPPKVEACPRRVRVFFNNAMIADTIRSKRVLETSHPPVFYIPMDDIEVEYLNVSNRRTFCEWKSFARYYSLSVDGRTVTDAGWSYPSPTSGFESIKNHVAFYPSLMDACYVGDEKATAQEGDFYGGWITSEIVGPFKGAPGTMGW